MKAFLRAFLLAEKQWGRRIIVGIALLLESATLIAIPIILGRLFDTMTLGSLEEGVALLREGAIWLVFIAFARAILIYGEIYFQEGTGNHIGQIIRQRIFRRLLVFPFTFFDRRKTGDLMSVLAKDVDAVRDGTGWVIMLAIVNAFIVVGIIGTMLYLHTLLALIILGIMPLLGIIGYIYGLRIGPLYQKVQAQSGRLHTVAQENISGIKVVKAFARKTQESQKFDRANEELYDSNLKIAFLNSLVHPTLDFLGAVVPFVALGAGGYFVIQGELTVGLMVTFTSFTEFLIWPIRQIGWLAELMQRALAGAKRVYDLLDTKDQLVLAETPRVSTMKGDIHFQGVSFKYEEEEVLKNFSLHVGQGQSVCLLGLTGSGKTTIANLLPRFYDPYKGVLRVDGVDVKDWDLSALRSQIGFVFQDNFLFSATLRENLTLGADYRDEEIWQAVSAAQARDFIERLPNKLDTLVGERGIGLSGGERQRLAIARALLRKPAILVFDDSSASLDMETEALLKEAVEAFSKGRTVLTIAQRVSTAKSADHIVVLEQGRIKEEGTHEELLAKQGHYALLHAIQNTSMRLPEKEVG